MSFWYQLCITTCQYNGHFIRKKDYYCYPFWYLLLIYTCSNNILKYFTSINIILLLWCLNLDYSCNSFSHNKFFLKKVWNWYTCLVFSLKIGLLLNLDVNYYLGSFYKQIFFCHRKSSLLIRGLIIHGSDIKKKLHFK